VGCRKNHARTKRGYEIISARLDEVIYCAAWDCLEQRWLGRDRAGSVQVNVRTRKTLRRPRL
jgi:hypothetical protein